ncbi:MAG: hypothetical protein Q9219_002296 [cf. Caloplaca sp. 3 TL-2023]
MLPVNEPAKLYPWRLQRLTQNFHKLFMEHFKIIDTSKGTIVSYAAWERPHPSATEEGSQHARFGDAMPDTCFPQGSNLSVIKDFSDQQDRLKVVHMDSTQDYYLKMLFTHPSYQGQGLASALLRQGLERIDAESRRCYLEASPAGLPIYRKRGWKVVDEIRVDLSKHGVESPYVDHTPCMMREAIGAPPKR